MLKERTNTAGNGKTYKTVRVNVCNKKMCNDLFNLGIVSNKSLTLQFPKNIPNSLIKHYLRGYFDGDGSISTNGTNRNGSKK